MMWQAKLAVAAICAAVFLAAWQATASTAMRQAMPPPKSVRHSSSKPTSSKYGRRNTAPAQLIRPPKLSARRQKGLTVKHWQNWRKVLIISVIALTIAGCGSFKKPSAAISPPPPDLAQPCPKLTAPADGKAGTLLLWAADVAAQYRDCAAKHRGLLEAWGRQPESADFTPK